ncbi:MAG: hypothetical protein ACK4TN_07630, partial [Brevinematales bacterium]
LVCCLVIGVFVSCSVTKPAEQSKQPIGGSGGGNTLEQDLQLLWSNRWSIMGKYTNDIQIEEWLHVYSNDSDEPIHQEIYLSFVSNGTSFDIFETNLM